MEKEQAEKYINYSKIKISQRKWFLLAILVCGFFSVPCLAIYHGIAYTVITVIMLVSAVVICIVGGSKKFRNEYMFSVFSATVVLILCTLFNLLMYGILMYINNLVWWAYLILIIFELVALVGTLLIYIQIAKRGANTKRQVFKIGTAASSAMMGHGLASIMMYVYHPSDNIWGFVLAALICFCVCLLEVGASAQIYRAYLIKKFDVK